MDIHSRPVLIFRWIVFLLAAGYCVNEILTSDFSKFGGPFRFLTIWALFLSFYSASRMLALSERRITQHHEVTAMCAAVLNIMVVFLYWRLYLADPKNMGSDIAWYEQYYLHGLGPLLQVIDALFVARVFRRIWRGVAPLLGLIVVYVLWAEFAVQPLNTTPTGSVSSGLPYPFLNNLELSGRLTFYVSNGAVAIALLGALAGLQWLIGLLIKSAPRS